VPLVATSPALAGIAGIIFLHERTSRRQLAGITLALAGATLLAAQP
jgi:drug/metabolite transporter (DMT)-like permease